MKNGGVMGLGADAAGLQMGQMGDNGNFGLKASNTRS